MKRILLIALPLVLVLGGVAGAMFYFGVPPFKKAVKKPAKPVAAAKTSAPVTDTHAAPAKPVTTEEAAPRGTPARPRAKARAAGRDIAADEQETARITRLSSVYEQMPAEDTGRIFAKLPDPLVEKLLRTMDERQVGKVLLALDVDRAARLTLSLANKAPQ